MSISCIPSQFWKREEPAVAGMHLDAVDTPALLLDLDAVDSNIDQVHKRIQGRGLAVRPHVKAHKCPPLALRQLAAGASGICCQKASEAEVFADAGFADIMITNQVVGLRKLERVARMAKRARIGICVDQVLQVTQAAQAAREQGSTIDVYIEIDIGHGRCGVSTSDAALALASLIADASPSLRLAGIHAFRGSAQHMRAPAERKNAVHAAVERLQDIIAVLKAAGHRCDVITGGGTGTYPHEADSGLYTEVQPGSYVLMDVDYASNDADPELPPLRHALFALCTVISVAPGHAVLDGGLKAFAVDQGLPRMVLPGWRVKGLSDEHAVIVPEPGTKPLAVGDKVRLIPGHCDPTVNLHDWLVAFRGESVSDVWPVSARGALF